MLLIFTNIRHLWWTKINFQLDNYYSWLFEVYCGRWTINWGPRISLLDSFIFVEVNGVRPLHFTTLHWEYERHTLPENLLRSVSIFLIAVWVFSKTLLWWRIHNRCLLQIWGFLYRPLLSVACAIVAMWPAFDQSFGVNRKVSFTLGYCKISYLINCVHNPDQQLIIFL